MKQEPKFYLIKKTILLGLIYSFSIFLVQSCSNTIKINNKDIESLEIYVAPGFIAEPSNNNILDVVDDIVIHYSIKDQAVIDSFSSNVRHLQLDKNGVILDLRVVCRVVFKNREVKDFGFCHSGYILFQNKVYKYPQTALPSKPKLLQIIEASLPPDYFLNEGEQLENVPKSAKELYPNSK